MQFTKSTLPNGLDVIVHEDHQVPLVAVNVWYHVGSKNESIGRTGLAHLFEHLMFEGGQHQTRGYFEPLQEAGATLNGSTSADRTNYWEVGPAGTARLALWMEADRMGWLLPALTQSRFDTQREVVLNERRQSYENKPYGLAQFALAEALFPEGHPYRWPTIGSAEDLRAATLDEVRAFFSRFYHPGNASLAIAGDIETARAMDVAEELFGEIPAGPSVPPVIAPVVPAAGRRIMFTDRVELPRLYLVWPSPALFAAGDADLDLAADLIANGRTSRLYRRLVHEQRIATELAAAQSSRELCGMFQILATAAPGHTLTEIEQAIVEALGDLSTHGPTPEELERSRVQAEAAFVYRLKTLGGFGGRADQLNAYNIYRGTPDAFATDLQRYLDVTAASLRDAVRTWLSPDRALALSVVPAGAEEQALRGSEVARPS
jgi:zinc protease